MLKKLCLFDNRIGKEFNELNKYLSFCYLKLISHQHRTSSTRIFQTWNWTIVHVFHVFLRYYQFIFVLLLNYQAETKLKGWFHWYPIVSYIEKTFSDYLIKNISYPMTLLELWPWYTNPCVKHHLLWSMNVLSNLRFNVSSN